MAERRMFAKSIIDSDAFLDMPLSTQALYFHLSMRADDDGFVNNPKRLSRLIGASDDEMKVLLAKKFILGFDNGVIVIKHWRIHNYIQKDRYKKTNYHEEKALLALDENNGYTLDTESVQLVDSGKVRLELGKDSKDKSIDKKQIEFTFTLKKLTQFENLTDEYKTKLEDEIIKLNKNLSFEDFTMALMAKGYKYKNFLLAYKTWVKNDSNKPQQNYQTPKSRAESNREFIEKHYGINEDGNIIDTEIIK